MLDFLASDDVQRFGLDLSGEYEVNAGTLTLSRLRSRTGLWECHSRWGFC